MLTLRLTDMYYNGSPVNVDTSVSFANPYVGKADWDDFLRTASANDNVVGGPRLYSAALNFSFTSGQQGTAGATEVQLNHSGVATTYYVTGTNAVNADLFLIYDALTAYAALSSDAKAWSQDLGTRLEVVYKYLGGTGTIPDYWTE